MDLPFFAPKKETPLSLRQKAEVLLAQAEDPALRTKSNFAFGETQLNRPGSAGDFRQFRLYRDGDRPQDIDWKRSARSDDLLIREREKDQRQFFDIHIQSGPGMDFQSSPAVPTKYAAACIFGLAFALWANQNHDSTGWQGQTPSINDLPHLMLEQKNRQAFWRKDAVTILIGDFIEPIKSLDFPPPSSNAVLLQILDPAELELPFEGRKIFEDGKLSSTIGNVDAVRKSYKFALEAHIQSLKDTARARGWHYGLIRTDENFAPGFNRALQSLESLR